MISSRALRTATLLGDRCRRSSITLEDVKAFYTKYFTRENLVIGLGGGYDESLLAKLRGDLGRLPAGKPEEVPPPVPAAFEGWKATIVEKDAPATAISMGFPIDILRGTKDWYALEIANSWLGNIATRAAICTRSSANGAG